MEMLDEEVVEVCPRQDSSKEDAFFDWADEASKNARLPRCEYVDAWCKVGRDERTVSCRHYWECRSRYGADR